MLSEKTRNKRIIKTKEKTSNSVKYLKENLLRLKSEIDNLISKPEMVSDFKFLRRVALNITHIDYNAKRARPLPKAEEIEHFLSTPMGAPFVSKTTLLRAAFHFSEQEPCTSDLHTILTEIAAYGPKFGLQLLRIFTLV